MKNTYEVTILNQKFLLKTEKDERHVQKVTEYVNEVFREIRDRAQNVSTQNIAILGALNIAEEMILKTEESKQLVTSWKKRLQGLISEKS